MRVLITQRVDVIADRAERRDALDQAWYGTLQSLVDCTLMIPVPNHCDAGGLISELTPGLIVLSGGNDIGQVHERDATEAALLECASSRRIPVLGVCRGMQMLNEWCGGALSPCVGHVGKPHPVAAVASDMVPQRLTVNSFHDQAIWRQDIAGSLRPLYEHLDGTVEAAAHHTQPWLGVMWHPERTGSESANGWLAHQLRHLS